MSQPKDELLRTQVGGDHYLQLKIQPWEIIDANSLNYYEGCILKYLMRKKQGQSRLIELQKARHYLDHLIWLEEVNEAEIKSRIEKEDSLKKSLEDALMKQAKKFAGVD